jgi:hypothetical protein
MIKTIFTFLLLSYGTLWAQGVPFRLNPCAYPITLYSCETLTMDFDDYADTNVWTHSGAAAFWLHAEMLNGTVHTNVNGWVATDARTGNIDFELRVPPVTSSNYACSLQNVAGAKFESPVYSGIGALSFDIVNGVYNKASPVDVLKATAMWDSVNGAVMPMGTEPGGGVDYTWVLVDTISVNYSTQGQYLSYSLDINIAAPIKIKIERRTAITDWSAEYNFMGIDNLSIAYLP